MALGREGGGGGNSFPSGGRAAPRTPDADGVPFAALFQAGCGRAMVQLELLWVAAALMLLGATVSLCLKCQLSGKVLPVCFGVLPATPGWAEGGGGVRVGRAFSLRRSPSVVGGFGTNSAEALGQTGRRRAGTEGEPGG